VTGCGRVRATLFESMKEVVDVQVDARTKSAVIKVNKQELSEKKLAALLDKKGYTLTKFEKVETQP